LARLIDANKRVTGDTTLARSSEDESEGEGEVESQNRVFASKYRAQMSANRVTTQQI